MGRSCGSVTRGGTGGWASLRLPKARASRCGAGAHSARCRAEWRRQRFEETTLRRANSTVHACRAIAGAGSLLRMCLPFHFAAGRRSSWRRWGDATLGPATAEGAARWIPRGPAGVGAKADSARVQRGLGGACRRDSPSEGSDSGSSSDWFSELLPTESSAPEGPPGAP